VSLLGTAPPSYATAQSFAVDVLYPGRAAERSRLALSLYPFSVGQQAELVLLVAAADLPRALAMLARA
jgi:hypothetical protein